MTATEENGFKMTAEQLEAAITPKTKALILNNPSNPTGMMYTEADLRKIAEVCLKHDLYVIADEIYYSLVYDGAQFTSFAALGEEIKERTILVNGVSKSYAMTGWRIGYAAANEHLAKVMGNYLSHSTGAPAPLPSGLRWTHWPVPRGESTICARPLRPPQLYRGADEHHRGRRLHQAPGRVLCDDEFGAAHRQRAVRRDHSEWG